MEIASKLHLVDWIVLSITLSFIVIYGTYVTRKNKNVTDYIKGGSDSKWWTIGLSVMATQASAITFLSTPGQAFHSGMGFVQFYFGLPIAMVIICVVFIPIYHKLKVYTAYEFLEGRFDLKTRSLAAILFLIQRGLAAGITIYAPAIILSAVLGWDLLTLNILIGFLVIIYTVSGGTKAVNVTQKQQMVIIFIGMVIAFYMILSQLPVDITFTKALEIAGASNKMEVIDFSYDLSNRYTIWDWNFRWNLFNVVLFWNRSKSGTTIFVRKIDSRKSNGIDFQWTIKGTDAIFHLADWGDGFCFLSVQSLSVKFQSGCK